MGAPRGNCNACKYKTTGHRPRRYKGRVSTGALKYLNKLSKSKHYRKWGWYKEPSFRVRHPRSLGSVTFS